MLVDWVGVDWVGVDWVGVDWVGVDWVGDSKKVIFTTLCILME